MLESLGGRTRARTWDPLIKRLVFSASYQRPFRQARHLVCIERTKGFPFVGMARPRRSGMAGLVRRPGHPFSRRVPLSAISTPGYDAVSNRCLLPAAAPAPSRQHLQHRRLEGLWAERKRSRIFQQLPDRQRGYIRSQPFATEPSDAITFRLAGSKLRAATNSQEACRHVGRL
jgi:hypothetical protein